MSRGRLLLADDHPAFLIGLRRLLEPEFYVLGTAADGESLVASAAALQPDLVVTDISMPGLNGLEAARRIAKVAPKCRVVFLSMHADDAFVLEAIRAGADGYLLKTLEPDAMIRALKNVLDGRQSFEREAPAMVADPRAATVASLSARQQQVFKLVAEGRSMKDIAAALHLSVKTVEFHKYSLMRQLELKTNADVTKLAIRLGII